MSHVANFHINIPLSLQQLGRAGREFKCKTCAKTYTRAASLKNHERIHTGERPHCCEECGEAFMTRDVLRSHKAVHLPDNARVRCLACGHKFTRISSLRRHEKSFCPQLDEALESPSQLLAAEDMLFDVAGSGDLASSFHRSVDSDGSTFALSVTPSQHPQAVRSRPLDELSDDDIREALRSTDWIDRYHSDTLFQQWPSRIWWIAAEMGHCQALKLLSTQAPLDVNNVQEDNTEQTALHIASRAGHHLAVRELLQMGAEVDSRARCLDTPLLVAVGAQQTETVKVLLNHKADIDAENDLGQSSLDLATEGESWMILDALLNGTESPVSKIRERGLLHRAIWNTSGSCAKLSTLLYHGANVTDRDNDGNTVLHAAAQTQDVQCMEKIFEKCNLVSARNQRGQTALHCLFLDIQLSYFDHWRDGVRDIGACLELLIANGTDVNAISHDGFTPLTSFVTGLAQFARCDVLESEFFEGCNKVCEQLRTLLLNKADPNTMNAYGATALDLVCQKFNKTLGILQQDTSNHWQRPKMVGPEQCRRAFLEVECLLKDFGALNSRDSLMNKTSNSYAAAPKPFGRDLLIR